RLPPASGFRVGLRRESAPSLLPRPEAPTRLRGRLARVLPGRVRGPRRPLDPARPAHRPRGGARRRARGGGACTRELRPLGLGGRPASLLRARALATGALL